MKKNLKTLAVDEAKKIAKTKANYTCEKCGRTKEETQIHGAHIMPVTYSGTAADPENILSLCAGCHSMGSNSSHQNPVQFSRWFDEMFPGRYDQLREKALAYSRNPIPRMDWVEVRKKLKEELNEIQRDSD